MAEILGIVTGGLQLVETVLKAREYITDFHNAPEEQQKVFAEVDHLEPLLTELQKRISASSSTAALHHMRRPLESFHTMMAELTDKLKPAQGGQWSKVSKQLTWTLWKKRETQKYLDEFEHIKSLLHVWLAVELLDEGQKHGKDQQRNHKEQQENHNRILKVIVDNAREQKIHRDAAQQAAILDWMTLGKPPLNFSQRQADIFSSWQPGTGEWLLSCSAFKEWESGSGKIIWCRGMPGAGKTVLSSLVVHYLTDQSQETNIGVAAIYLNHKETEVQTPVNILTSLWKQLVAGKALSPEVVELYTRLHRQGIRPAIHEVFDMLKLAIAKEEKFYLVVDALDEYPEDHRNILLKYLSRAMLGSTVNLMITSRPHIIVDASFPEVQIVEIRATEDDIRKYVDIQITESSRLSRHVQTCPGLAEEIKSKIVDNVEGMFLLAKLHTGSLATKNTIKAVRHALQHLPANLNQTYDDAMNRINSQNTDDQQLAHLVLTWVAYAKRPLSVEELGEALTIEPNATNLDPDNRVDINIVLSVCAGLIIVDEEMAVVRLIHYTTQHYFDAIRAIQFPDAHTYIASRCLEYFLLADFDNIHFQENHGPNPSAEKRATKLVAEHPFLAYNVWCFSHISEENEMHLQHKIQSLLSKVSSWNWFFWNTSVWSASPPWRFLDWPSSPCLLWISASCNFLKIATHLLEAGTEATAHYGHIEMVQLLMRFGADINARLGGTFFDTVLQSALAGEQEVVAQFLIDHGADVNAEGGFYGTALRAAAEYGLESFVILLLELGADINAWEGPRTGTALQAASEAGHESVVRLLIEKGANVNAEAFWPGTALQAASYHGHEPIVRLLLERDADKNLPGGKYRKALQNASINGKDSIVNILIEKGAEVNAEGPGNWPESPLKAASYGGHISTVQLLIDNGAEVNAQAYRCGTALQMAAKEGHEGVVQLLISNGAAVNARGGLHGTALHVASYTDKEPVVRVLGEMDVDLNQVAHHTTALWVASVKGHLPVVHTLIELGADINKTGDNYGTPIEAAQVWGHQSVNDLIRLPVFLSDSTEMLKTRQIQKLKNDHIRPKALIKKRGQNFQRIIICE
ncbi:ankyrin repeat-containing domain protein [Mycena capillaripes]|nr:ankyrin repeat-containing domain protein [Mycena capillaripes]